MVELLSFRTLLSQIGISNTYLTIFFAGLGILVFLWGINRYRTTFSRTELSVSFLIAVGLLFLAFGRGIASIIGEFFNVDSRFVLVQIVVNVVFILLILYIITKVSNTQATIGNLTRNLSVQQIQRGLGNLVDENEKTIYIIIPAYNEESTIGSLLEELPNKIKEYAIRTVVVSDGSEDMTTQIAREYDAIVIEHPINQGQGGALKTGFQIAISRSADIVVTMDADGQHPIKQLPNLVTPIITDTADYVVGSRHRGKDQSGNSLTRQSGIWVFTWIINRLLKTDITDCTNGYRAIRGTELSNLTLSEERFSAPELIIESKKNGLRIQEIPVTIRERKAGETKKPKLGYAIGLIRTIITTWIR